MIHLQCVDPSKQQVGVDSTLTLLRPDECLRSRSHLGRRGHGTGHLHLRVHDLCLRGHGGDLRADGVCAVLLLPQLDQLLGEDLTRLPVPTLCHFFDFCLLRGEKMKD